MIKQLDESNFNMDQLNNNIILLDFGAEYCTGCKNLEPIVSELSREYKGIVFYKVEADKNLNISKKFKISNLPTIVILNNGEVSEYLSGFQPKQKLKDILNKYI